jgi:hypothetical protein
MTGRDKVLPVEQGGGGAGGRRQNRVRRDGDLSEVPPVDGYRGPERYSHPSRCKRPAIPNVLPDRLPAGDAASAASEKGGLPHSLKKALTCCA